MRRKEFTPFRHVTGSYNMEENYDITRCSRGSGQVCHRTEGHRCCTSIKKNVSNITFASSSSSWILTQDRSVKRIVPNFAAVELRPSRGHCGSLPPSMTQFTFDRAHREDEHPIGCSLPRTLLKPSLATQIKATTRRRPQARVSRQTLLLNRCSPCPPYPSTTKLPKQY